MAAAGWVPGRDTRARRPASWQAEGQEQVRQTSGARERGWVVVVPWGRRRWEGDEGAEAKATSARRRARPRPRTLPRVLPRVGPEAGVFAMISASKARMGIADRGRSTSGRREALQWEGRVWEERRPRRREDAVAHSELGLGRALLKRDGSSSEARCVALLDLAGCGRRRTEWSALLHR